VEWSGWGRHLGDGVQAFMVARIRWVVSSCVAESNPTAGDRKGRSLDTSGYLPPRQGAYYTFCRTK
jgi:hypothetical protein